MRIYMYMKGVNLKLIYNYITLCISICILYIK